MALIGKIVQNSRISARVSTSGDSIRPSTAPITLKNQIKEIRSIEDFGDVDEVNVTGGATLVYNSESDKYEVRPLQLSDLGNLDGGSF